MLEKLINNAEVKLNEALGYAMKVVNANSKTEILNAEYCMGKFMAYMEMIEKIDINKYVELGEKTKETRNTILMAIDKLYR